MVTHQNNNKKSVLIAASIYPPAIGGPAVYAKKLAEELIKLGIKIKVICYGDKVTKNNFFSISSVSLKIPKLLRHFIYFLKLFFSAFRYKIIYAFDPLSAGLLGALVSKILFKKFVIRIGGDLLWERKFDINHPCSLSEFYSNGRYLNFFSFKIIRKVLLLSDRIIVPTKILKEIYEIYYGVVSEKISIIFNPTPDIDNELYDGVKNNKDIIFAGRMIDYKNISVILRALKLISGDLYRKFLIIGDGPDKENIMKIIKNLDLTDKVQIIAKLSHNDLLMKIKESAIAISPSFTDFNPNFILEAIALKKPFIISRENGLPLNLFNEFIFESHNEKELADKIIWIFKNYDLAQQKISSLNFKWNWQDVMREHLDLINQISNIKY